MGLETIPSSRLVVVPRLPFFIPPLICAIGQLSPQVAIILSPSRVILLVNNIIVEVLKVGHFLTLKAVFLPVFPIIVFALIFSLREMRITVSFFRFQ